MNCITINVVITLLITAIENESLPVKPGGKNERFPIGLESDLQKNN